jgi:hypothetical protein
MTCCVLTAFVLAAGCATTKKPQSLFNVNDAELIAVGPRETLVCPPRPAGVFFLVNPNTGDPDLEIEPGANAELPVSSLLGTTNQVLKADVKYRLYYVPTEKMPPHHVTVFSYPRGFPPAK